MNNNTWTRTDMLHYKIQSQYDMYEVNLFIVLYFKAA